tara:strand:- start:3631 stop:3990 length:360 start_codon:yes stop_codon:yes gene_type:complete
MFDDLILNKIYYYLWKTNINIVNSEYNDGVKYYVVGDSFSVNYEGFYLCGNTWNYRDLHRIYDKFYHIFIKRKGALFWGLSSHIDIKGRISEKYVYTSGLDHPNKYKKRNQWSISRTLN